MLLFSIGRKIIRAPAKTHLRILLAKIKWKARKVMGQREGYYGKLTHTEVKKFREEENDRKIKKMRKIIKSFPEARLGFQENQFIVGVR